ncbi:ankyrin repeat-containing domain protein [Massariosphaeria phaeospora]|uniref:Ankyrin repeat-containing domain protein n=1 Tax=Massariosphaeria phaeospora TaxID=100035 RepID=A0A7C8M5Y4_9PLEO|nr:ankyrin repeat-containing domain protein [Massariosphaeria phaeospora]
MPACNISQVGADANAIKGWNGQSALMIAIHFGNAEVAKLLIANGATVSYAPPACNLTALHQCVRLAVAGSPVDALDIVKILFQYGANANQADRIGETALHKLLIDAWSLRHDDVCIQNIIPIALCLVQNGARMPTTTKERYLAGNPLWDTVETAMLQEKSGRCSLKLRA